MDNIFYLYNVNEVRDVAQAHLSSIISQIKHYQYCEANHLILPFCEIEYEELLVMREQLFDYKI